jgi:hypothetical protein
MTDEQQNVNVVLYLLDVYKRQIHYSQAEVYYILKKL